ncbi:alkene reductase [Bradyrhizobium sp. KB893862 SZCCT0404]|uniref:alkene reductase n=1 Tax=Bradyrhizobium sp. KB893862 SZCCT0404 TaxID=2807672 RepID=UPI001BA7E03F|nr:alkene reductase [Bradyrhizobium sp. KB893862 SZCCT0404]MBR1174732.1 alkene reductase [Bradyrhizobium sp. KB893862 SZCCT0404]
MSKLYQPVQIGAVRLDHRIVQAPLTRLRSDQPGDVPSAMMVKYYAQRASKGGLQIAEATPVSVQGRGYLGAPGIYNDAQVEGWRKVVDAVHAKGGVIFLQLWHVGRQSHVSLTGGDAPLAPSAVQVDDLVYTKDGWIKTSPNRALDIAEIKEIVEQFREGAIRAKAAGFDGVEIHGANGYLIDQFLQDGSNKRTDIYGGSIENRARFLLEVTEAVTAVWGGDRVGVRLGPSGTFGSMSDSNPDALFGYAAQQLNRFGLAYLHLIEPRIDGSKLRADGLPPVAARQLRRVFNGPIIAAGGFERDSAAAIVESGDADLVAFGRHFAANPDLVERLRRDLPLSPHDRDTFYGGDERGYVDYPRHDEPADVA